jgi:hypothetical protein
LGKDSCFYVSLQWIYILINEEVFKNIFLNKLKFNKNSVSVTLATFQVLDSHMYLVAIVWHGSNVEKIFIFQVVQDNSGGWSEGCGEG